MSINVTVTGNPVSIKRGKMVTADPDYAKREFQRRRRMRLEQVRQQSKDIAENVRSKVRKEKKKQLSEIEQEGANKLKEWQSRKLLELQQQYCENLKDIGLGHTGAAVEETREDLVGAYKDVLREKSRERGYAAAKHLHDEKEDNALAKTLKSQQRKDARNLEKTRSAMVSKIRTRTQNSSFKKKKQKRPVTSVNISSIVDDSQSSLDSDFSVEVEESSDNYARNSPRKLKPETDDVTTTSLSKTESPKKSRITHEKQILKKKRKSPETNRSPPGSPEPIRHPQKIPSPPERPFNYPLDTRISDRIKRRLNIPLNQPISKSYLPENFVNKVTQSSPTMDEISTQTKMQPFSIPVESNIELQIPKADFRCQPCNHSSADKSCQLCRSKENIRKSCVRETCQPYKCKENVAKSSISRPCDDIPEKPRITLKSSSKTSKFDGGDFNKVQYYDHANRYSKEYLCDNSCVQKIQDDSIQICPSTSSEQEFIEKIYKRDRDALERGKKAMEKEKIHRDYKEMMQQLPVLQKQERIASINSNNPIFHMSDERLKLYELRRQNQMEEAYEKYFPCTPLITVPPKKHDVQTEPFRVIDVSNNQPALNLATWDVDSINKDVIVTKDDGLISVSAETTQDRTEYLKNLLEKLKMQREMLMREVDSLPKDSNLRNLIQKSDFHELKAGVKKKMTSSRAENGDCYCPETGSYHSKGSKDARKPTKKVSSHYPRTKHKILLNSSNSSTSPSPRKRTKHRKYTLVLQNTSTQTTPKRLSPTLAKSLESRTTQQQQTITLDRRHFEVQIGEDKSKSPKEKLPSKKIASSQTDFTSQVKVLSSTTKEKDKVDSTAPSLKANEKDKKAKTKESHAVQPPNISRSPRSKHSKGSSTNSVSDNVKLPCEGNDEICEILIKIKDEEPEIVIKSPKKTHRPLLVKADIQKNIKKKLQLKKQLQFQTEVQPDLPKDKSKSDATAKTTSWKEYFSRNNSLGTSTSTSYYSPPDFRSSTKSELKEQLDPRLLTYIRKLLTMSRASVEDLGVSSVSEISTPAPSLISNENNDSLNQLRNIIKYFNLNPEELARCLNYSNETDDNTRGSSTSSSSLFVSRQYKGDHKETNASSSNVSGQHSSSTDKSTSLKSQNESQKYKVISTRIEKIVEQTARNIEGSNVRQINLETFTDQNYPSALSQYTKIAEMCHQRISNLSDMIQKVRQEKQQMLSPNISDKENSTSYMNLPSQLGATSAMSESTTARPNTPNMNVSSSSEAEQSELTRKLLEIDYSLVDKLQKLSPAELKKQVEQMNEPQVTGPDGEIDNDLMTRYRALLDDNNDNIPSTDRVEQFEKKQPEISQTNQVIVLDKQSSELPFIPLLLDIPRLPKLTLSSTSTNLDENEEKTKAAIHDAFTELNHFEKKPPPSKGLSAAKKFNNNITGIPHELSTIVEVDSQLSTKARQSASPINSGHQVFENIKPLVVPPNPQNSIWTTQAVAKLLSDESLPDILTELVQQPPQNQSSSSTEKQEVIHNKEDQRDKVDGSDVKRRILTQKQLNMYQMSQVIADQSTDSSTDKSELENVEAMLKSMGMGWAVATIRKTQEALTRASSSSSLETSGKKQQLKTSDKSNSSDVSLRQFLDSKIFNRSSESGSKITDSSLSPFLRELQEISAVQGSGGSSETKNQRTSTPVQTTKSSDKSKNESQKGVFLVESDLSSVKSKPDDMFMTMPSDISMSTGSQSKSSDL